MARKTKCAAHIINKLSNEACKQINARNIKTFPHQKVVQIVKTNSDKEHLYGICNIESMLTAAQSLSDRAFKLYARLNLHQNEYTFALSAKEIHQSIGLSEARYRNAVKELIATGYLVQSPTQSNLYTFYEFPPISQSTLPPTSSNLNEPESSLLPSESEGQILQNNTNYITDIVHNASDDLESSHEVDSDSFEARKKSLRETDWFDLFDDLTTNSCNNTTSFLENVDLNEYLPTLPPKERALWEDFLLSDELDFEDHSECTYYNDYY